MLANDATKACLAELARGVGRQSCETVLGVLALAEVPASDLHRVVGDRPQVA